MINIGAAGLPEALIEQSVRPLFSRPRARPPIYLANHSLGRPPDRVAEDVQRALDAWYRDMGEAWESGSPPGSVFARSLRSSSAPQATVRSFRKPALARVARGAEHP
jgi:kynureninase